MKFKKSKENKTSNKKNGSCWDRIQQYIKIISDSNESIRKSLSHISIKSTSMIKNEIHSSNLKKKNEVTNKIFTDLKNVVNNLKASKTKINAISNISEEKSIARLYKLPN